MNKINILMGLLLFIGVASCTSKKAADGFTVNGEFSGVSEKFQIMISENIPVMKSWFVDTIDVVDGKFSYTGKVEYPEMMVFSLMQDDNFMGSFGILMDNSTIRVKGSIDDLANLKIEGGKANDEYNRIMEQGDSVFYAYNQIKHRRSAAFKEDKKLYESLSQEYEEAYAGLKDYILGVKNYGKNPAIPYIVYYNFGVSRPDMLEELLNAVDSSQYANPYISHLQADLARERKVYVGANAYDFELPDADGNTCKLSDYKGKYILLEFTASWCGWCKKEIPFLQKLYDETQGENLQMITIYIDKNRDEWISDMQKHPLPWLTLCDLKAIDGPAPKAYNVHGIPSIFLIGPDGKIEAKGLRGEAMIKTVKDILDKQ